MRKFYLLLAAFVAIVHASQGQTIAAARAQGPAAGVTTRGIVTNGPELGPIRYYEDGTGGIAAYFAAAQLAATPIFPGDSIEVTGTLVLYNNLLEYNPISSFRVISHRNPLHGPLVYSAANASQAFTEENEGRLIRLNGVASITTTAGGPISTFSGNTAYKLNGVAAQAVFINTSSNSADSGLVGKPAPTGTFDLIGIVSQFCRTPASGCNTSYQILPRVRADFVTGPEPIITSQVTADSLTLNSFVLNFTTQNAGTTRVYYGLSPALTNQVTDPNLTTAHAIRLNGLLPGRIYYVRVQSQNSGGISNGNIQTFVTESNSSGKMVSYFTQSVNTTTALPSNNAVTLTNLVDDTLVSYINRATQTLDIAIYNYNNSGYNADIAAALNAAKSRGVIVRVIADGASANAGLRNLQNIPVLRSPTGRNPATGGFYTIMHNKFVVIDAEAINPNSPIVWTGSTNWTDDQLSSIYNNVVIVQDQSLARIYTLEFEEMWGSKSDTAGAIFNGTTGTARFGASKTDNTPHEAKIGGKRVEVYFSPSDGVNRNIIRTIGTANSSFQFAQLLITRNELAFALRDQYARVTNRTCTGGVVSDTSSSGGTPYNILQGGTAGAFKLFASRTILHHKYLVVDQDNATSDPLVWTGSHNWSAAGDQSNDENSIVIHDQSIANQYYQEFAARFAENNGSICPIVANKPLLGTGLTAYPNPAANVLTLTGLEKGSALFVITDISGRAVATGKTVNNQVTLANLKVGVYHLNLNTESGNQHLIFAKQ